MPLFLPRYDVCLLLKAIWSHGEEFTKCDKCSLRGRWSPCFTCICVNYGAKHYIQDKHVTTLAAFDFLSQDHKLPLFYELMDLV